jgi:biopolymer transport protein ExbD
MSEVVQEQGKGKKKGAKKVSTRIDFTPMVDLGFLLITFFMLTTTMIKPQTMEIAMPSKDKVTEEEETKVKNSRAVTIILGKDNKVYYYEGTRDDKTGIDPKVVVTDFSAQGLRKFLIQKNYDVIVKVEELKQQKQKTDMPQEEFDKKKNDLIADKAAPVVIIKATNDASYKNLIDVLDEMSICSIGRYAIVDITDYDMELLTTQSIL